MPIDPRILQFFIERGGDPEGSRPELLQDLYRFASDAERATGGKARFTDMYRPPETQAQYRANYLQKPVAWAGKMYYPQEQGGLAAPPGLSRHGWGGATDIAPGPVLDWMHANVGSYPTFEFLKGKNFRDDPGHLQLARLPVSSPSRAAAVASSTPPAPGAGLSSSPVLGAPSSPEVAQSPSSNPLQGFLAWLRGDQNPMQASTSPGERLGDMAEGLGDNLPALFASGGAQGPVQTNFLVPGTVPPPLQNASQGPPEPTPIQKMAMILAQLKGAA